MALQIVHYNEPVLRKKGEKIKVFDAALQRFAADMVEAMHEAEGIGLAAQQVGRAIMLCVMDLRESKADFTWIMDGVRLPLDLFMPLVLANPVVTMVPDTADYVYEEGCLSFPKIRGDVIRPDAITVKFQDEKGTPHVMTCDGLLARCVQHEVDHLNGVLFIDRMEKPVRAEIEEDIKTLAKKTKTAGKPTEKP